MNHKTAAALIEACYAFLELPPQIHNNPTAQARWDRVVSLHQAALRLHEQAAGPQWAGKDYSPGRDGIRLDRQLGRLFQIVGDGQWHTLHELVQTTGDPQSSVSAQLRNLRKPKYGGWVVERGRAQPGQHGPHAYRLRNPDGSAIPPLQPSGE